MKKKNLWIRIGFVLCFLLIFMAFKSKFNTCYAAINTNYGEQNETYTEDSVSSSVIVEWIGSLGYSFGSFIESICSNIVGIFTGVQEFPWADKIIFNGIAFLDVNFINPAEGSLFKDVNGDFTLVGNLIRKTYFSVLSISLAFLGVIVAILAIKLALSTIGSNKAKYKELIMKCLTTLVLLFGMHYILSFAFYLNEKMVEVASYLLLNIFTDSDAQSIVDEFNEASTENDKRIVENFVKACDPNWLSPITLVREAVKAVANIIQSAIDFLKDAWESFKNWISGEDDSEEITIGVDELEKIYPSRQAFADYFTKDEQHIHVSAYLLKDYYYRETYLSWVEGTDTNSFSNSGISGVGKGIVVAVNDFFAIVDTGYLGLRALYSSVSQIFDGTSEDLNGNKMDDVGFANIITSTNAYNNYIESCNKLIEECEKNKKATDDNSLKKQYDNEKKIYKLCQLYASAYYKFIYDGDDKIQYTVKDLVGQLGEYFKQNSHYYDLDAGDWSPTSVSIVYSILYAVFVIQSVMFLFSYIKRLFYVVILSVFGPIVVVFDLLSQAIL